MEYRLELLTYLLIFKLKNEKIAKFDEQIKICINIFEKITIDEKELIYLFERNILDINPCIRSICWKLALKHIGLNSEKWNEELITKRKLYEDYIKCFITNPSKYEDCDKSNNSNTGSYSSHNRSNNNTNDNTNKNPNENIIDQNKRRFKFSNINDDLNSELFSQINKDTFRTRPDLSFFNLNPQQTINNNINALNNLMHIDEFEDDDEEIPTLVNPYKSTDYTYMNETSCKGYSNKCPISGKIVEVGARTETETKAGADARTEVVVEREDTYREFDKCGNDCTTGITNVTCLTEPSHNKANEISTQHIKDKKINLTSSPDMNKIHSDNTNDFDKEKTSVHIKKDKQDIQDLKEMKTSVDISIKTENKNTIKDNNCSSNNRGHIHSNNNERKDNIYGYSDMCDIVNPRRHYDILCRILYIYANLHPYVKYVQGMNEILAPIYFIIFNDPLCNCCLQGEADTFFCFLELMQKQKDVFCERLDNTDDGINGKLQKFVLLLKIKEYDLWKKLYTLKIKTQYYALKWILLLLTQEFDMADSIILYDHFIINTNENFILYICLVICRKLKSSLLYGNFTVNLKLLQNIPPFDPFDIIYEAKNLMHEDTKNNFDITDVYNHYVTERKKKKNLKTGSNIDSKINTQNNLINYLGKNELENSSSISSSSSSSSSSSLDSISSPSKNKYHNQRFGTTTNNNSANITTGTIFNNLKNKFMVKNITNYISNKIDMKRNFNEHWNSDEF
ncbi:TBC domain protein, putative [Hepatocystis sp. ex Piliocolobus tephrosceles]|nr:TBC domain protein, putative [Hepatocystis sp. ex Piliocolobus tephrosceles]